MERNQTDTLLPLFFCSVWLLFLFKSFQFSDSTLNNQVGVCFLIEDGLFKMRGMFTFLERPKSNKEEPFDVYIFPRVTVDPRCNEPLRSVENGRYIVRFVLPKV